MTVVLGVTGCIAAYKSCEIARLLIGRGYRVKTVMTENATRFVGPTTLRALTGEPVATSLWDEPSSRVHHLSLAEEASVLLVAPATANIIAKLASGRADDLLTTVALATEAPLVIAPAMNVHMWRAPATMSNVAILQERGATLVGPDAGELACGDTGEGRLAHVDAIVEEVIRVASRSFDLKGVDVLVTAGPTREFLDPVRFITNASSGLTGYAIAEEAARRGARVRLISGATTIPDPFGVRMTRVVTADEMGAAVDAAYPDCDVFVATAAVADERPIECAPIKWKKTGSPRELTLVPTRDILASLASSKSGRLHVGFAAETQDVIVNAASKLDSKNLDMVVANDVSDPAMGFATQLNRVWFVTREGADEPLVMTKRSIAAALWDRVSDQARSAARIRRGEST
jgi:phosphopantothenoylcysteine decarboxylase/phosphopantothenate--cysteine ligase